MGAPRGGLRPTTLSLQARFPPPTEAPPLCTQVSLLGFCAWEGGTNMGAKGALSSLTQKESPFFWLLLRFSLTLVFSSVSLEPWLVVVLPLWL